MIIDILVVLASIVCALFSIAIIFFTPKDEQKKVKITMQIVAFATLTLIYEVYFGASSFA